MEYIIEYYTTDGGSSMVIEQFHAGDADEARLTAGDLLADYRRDHRADYALYWAGDGEAKMVEI